MNLQRLVHARPYHPSGHVGVGPVHLQGGTGYTGAVTVALSHYLPGGHAGQSSVPAETIYVVVAGELVVITDTDTVTLGPLDSVRLTAGTIRSVVNETNLPASMLVIRPVME